MAAPTIKIKRSAVSGNAPTTAQLELGELALNTYDGKLFTEINTGSASIVEIGSNLNTLQVNTITSNVSFTADATFTGANYNVVWDKSDNSLEFADNAKAVFGAGSDLSVYHSGNHSFIDDTGTGNLKVRSNNLRFSNADESKLYGSFTPTSVDLYYNNTKRFNTSVIGVEVTGHSELDNIKSVGIATFTGNAIHANVYSTGISTISGFRFPTSDGSEDQSLVTDGNGSLSFKTISGGGGATGSATTISAGVTTATQGQTVFSTPHPHNDGTDTYSTQVFVNGVKQRPQGAGNATKDFTTSSNSTITFEEGITAGSEVVSMVYFGHTVDEEYFTATEGQVLFPLTGSLSAQKNFRVFQNGIKLRSGTDYGVSAPVTLIAPAAEGAHVEIVCDNAEDAFVATDQQTNFTPTSSDISSNNMQVYINGVQLFKGLDFTIGSPSVTLVDAMAAGVGDQYDVCIRRTA